MPRALGAQRRRQHQQQHEGHAVFAEMAPVAGNLQENAVQEIPLHAVSHDQGKGDNSSQRDPDGRGRLRGANEHNNVSEDAPAGNVIDGCASDGHGAQAAVEHVPLCKMRASTGNAVMLMAAPMNSAKLVKATLSSESRG
jgi:hypothetical protein